MRCGGPAVWVEPLQDPAIRGGRPCSSPCKPRRAGSLGLAISTQPRGRRCRGFSPVQRLSDCRVLGMLAVAAAFILAAAAPAPAAPAAAEAEDDPSLRPSEPGLPDPTAATPRSPARPLEQVPVYTRSPGSGAGATGFVSTGTARRKTQLKAAGSAGRQGPANASAGVPQPPALPALPTRPDSANEIGQARAAVPQLARHGAPPIDPPPGTDQPTLGPLPPVMPRRAPADPAPFDPLGLRVGAFLLRPAVELSGG
jgi:hypothetical protein